MRPASMLLLPALGLSTPAFAQWPDDISLTQLATYDGQPATNLEASRGAYEQVVRELAATIANKPVAPAETSGLAGFDVAMTTRVGFIDSKAGEDGKPVAWQRTHAEGDPSGVLFIPGISARKGLPLSTEVGANFGYIAASRQSTFGAYGRVAPLEGYKQAPDVVVQVGYAAYLGNEQLDLGVMDVSASVGYTFAFGRISGINEASISPWVGAGWLTINAVPTLDPELQQDLGVRAVSGFKSKDHFVEGFRPATLAMGARLRSGDVQMLFAGTLTTTQDRATPTLELGVGYLF